jgi:hypothetical protein
MAVYTVHQPPLRADRPAEPERFAFVRDGFSFWALLLGPLWMLRHRMWIVLVCYLAILAILGAVLRDPHDLVHVTALLGLLIGLEAATLRRFTLARRGWTQIGLVVGDDLELAERRFFDSWVGASANHQAASSSPPPPINPAMRMTAASSDVLGLFPEPGAPT